MQPLEGSPTLQFYTEHNPPFTYLQEGSREIDGITMTVVKELMRRANIPYSVELIPWNRAYAQALHRKNTCVFGMNRTPAREDKFLWVSPLFAGPWSFYKRPDSDIELASIEDISTYKVVATAGYATAAALEATGHKKTLLATSNERSMQLLFHGRVDLLLIGDTEVPFVAKNANTPLPVKALHFRDTVVALGCNLNTDPAVIAKLQAVNAEMDEFRALANKSAPR
ncbi:MAG: transporter substrate-binding domain-containing protein [Alphaproteobacteria bacterium]|nr:transporter substrate-binding domain-containing protein [Alphaproteobacteria bacterium]